MKTYLKSVLAIIAILLCACEKDPTFAIRSINDNATKVSSITTTSAEVIVSIFETESGDHYNYNHNTLEVYYSTSSNPLIEPHKCVRETLRYEGTYTFRLSYLEPGTTYYYAPKLGNQYGKVRSFKTKGITVETGTATDITSSSAKLSGKCTLNGSTLQESGILVHMNSSLSYTNCIRRFYGTFLDFVANVTGLMGNTTYYYCAYAKDSEGNLYYGAVKNFTTQNQSIRNAKTAVDLGLSVKWAAGNVGATYETDYGNLYAWGETMTKSSYVWGTYLYCNYKNAWSGMTKYTIPDGQTAGDWYSYYGTFIGDNKRTLTSSDDAANANWGGNWRMPTESELAELANSCSWDWVVFHGIQGFWIAGPNGNSIFLPAAGWRVGTDTHTLGLESYYWTSSLSTYSDKARAIFISSGSSRWESKDRFYGFAVRAVCE